MCKNKAVQDIIESHQIAVADERRRNDIAARNVLFEVDTIGSVSRRKKKWIQTSQNPRKKPREELERERNWIARREQTLKKESERRNTENSVFDIWSTTELPQKKSKRNSTPSLGIPKVVVADVGQSVNPSHQDWKKFLVSISARFSRARELDSSTPVTEELKAIFPPETIDSLSVQQQLQLFRVAKDSAELLENPEDFLARVLPTLGAAEEETKPELDVEASGNDTCEGEKKPSNKPLKKRSREERRKQHEMEVKAFAQRKALRKQFEQLSEILKSIDDGERRTEARKAYRQALREYWRESGTRGEVKSFRIGKNKFEDPAEVIASKSDLDFQGGSLRKLAASRDRVVLRDRLGSIYRRGLIELPTSLTSAKFRQLRSKFGRKRNYKRKLAQKLSLIR
eukprot:Gregarina_sp_Poly_1__11396@NODE_969_length_5525_cov_113_202272_g685_i0_p3_GENE_NODE_969_length_5525_cov_113_202272_g685_i0NODE_969_length_5525_cov_113_202272_g685_i0_p3_ORF_typecomplete_len399_score69_11Nop53/PF07767_11/1_1e22DUF2458/PF10454_9/0_47DUF2458/PF10454_9/34_NODE_969_length_5525_cov_113_202272_g685_i042665462